MATQTLIDRAHAARTLPRAKHVLTRRSTRYAIYQIIAAGLMLAAVAARSFHAWRGDEPLNFIVSDARGYYVYLPSIAHDGDLDLRNQMLATYGRELDRLDYDINAITTTGLVPNKYSIGMALTLSPAFALAHVTAWIGSWLGGGELFAPDGYSPPYQLFCLALILMLSAGSMILLDRLMERYLRLGGVAIASGVIAFWLGSHYAWYCFREPFMIHVVSTFWVTLAVAACAHVRFGFGNHIRDTAPLSTRRRNALPLALSVLALATSMAIVSRPTNVLLAPFVVWAIASLVRRNLRVGLLRALPWATLAALLPVAVQVIVWRILYGSWFHYSYGGERFVWTEPALFQTLFGLHKGLFIWTPLLWFAMAGLPLAFIHAGGAARARRELAICWIAAAIILWYLNSAWWAWGFGWSFGARAFLELAGMFVLGLVLLFEWVQRQSLSTKRFAVLLLCALFLYNYVMMGLYQTRRINRGDWEAGGWTRAGAPASFIEHVEKHTKTNWAEY